jgi:hypothetical protein
MNKGYVECEALSPNQVLVKNNALLLKKKSGKK